MAESTQKELLENILERLPPPKAPYDQLREDLHGYDKRLIHIEAWQSIWRWAVPVVIVVFIGVIQIIAALFK